MQITLYLRDRRPFVGSNAITDVRLLLSLLEEKRDGDDLVFSNCERLAAKDLEQALGLGNPSKQLFFVAFRMFFETYDTDNRATIASGELEDEDEQDLEEDGNRFSNKRQRQPEKISEEEAREIMCQRLGLVSDNTEEDDEINDPNLLDNDENPMNN